MLGFGDKEEAEKGYLENYDKDWKGLGNIVEKPFDEFKEWATNGDTVTELEKAGIYERTRFGKIEIVRKPTKWKVTFADGSKVIVDARHSKEAVDEGKKLSKFTVQRVENLEKSKQVQVKPYQRKGKYVIGYHRFDPREKMIGEPFTVERMLPTPEALEVGKKLSREEILEIWDEYKRINVTPPPEDLKEYEKRAFRTQTLREIVEGYLGSETALTPEEIDEKLGTTSSLPEAKIEKQLNPERADIRLALEVIDDISRAGGKAMIVADLYEMPY